MKNLHTKPKYRSSKTDPQLPKYFAEVVGLSNSSLGGTIDGAIRMIQAHAAYTIAFCPLPKQAHPSYAQARFFGDCLCFELDSPVVVFPLRSEFYKHRYDVLPVARPLSSTAQKLRHVYDTYTREVSVALESVWSMRSGGLASVSYSSEEMDYDTDFPFTSKYSKVSRELQLYAHALRQLDPLGEFLAYYRILESVVRSNARKWIASNLVRIGEFKTGSVTIKNGLTSRKSDLFSLYKRRAMLRLLKLRNYFGSDDAIAKYLYVDNRCGIAHAKDSIRQSDFGDDYFSVAKDNYLMKLLTRLSIEDKRHS